MALVELALFHDPIAAEIVRGRLASEGIEAVVFDAGVGGLGIGPIAPVRLMVDDGDHAAAERVLAED